MRSLIDGQRVVLVDNSIISCYTGVYPVAFPRDDAACLQLALKLNPERAANDRRDLALPQLEKDSVAS